MYPCGFNPAWRTERGAAYKDYVCWTWPTLSSSLPYFPLNHAEKGRTRALSIYILQECRDRWSQWEGEGAIIEQSDENKHHIQHLAGI